MICHYKSNPVGNKGKIRCKRTKCAIHCVGEANCDFIKEQEKIIKRQTK